MPGSVARACSSWAPASANLPSSSISAARSASFCAWALAAGVTTTGTSGSLRLRLGRRRSCGLDRLRLGGGVAQPANSAAATARRVNARFIGSLRSLNSSCADSPQACAISGVSTAEQNIHRHPAREGILFCRSEGQGLAPSLGDGSRPESPPTGREGSRPRGRQGFAWRLAPGKTAPPSSAALPSGLEHLAVDTWCRVRNLGCPRHASEELRRAHRPDDGVAIPRRPHVVETGPQQRRTDAGPTRRLRHPDGPDKAACGGVVAAETDQLRGLTPDRNDEAARPVGERGASLARPGRRETLGDPGQYQVMLGRNRLANGEGFGSANAVLERKEKPDEACPCARSLPRLTGHRKPGGSSLPRTSPRPTAVWHAHQASIDSSLVSLDSHGVCIPPRSTRAASGHDRLSSLRGDSALPGHSLGPAWTSSRDLRSRCSQARSAPTIVAKNSPARRTSASSAIWRISRPR
ncbi:MAG: hypothetical protein MZV70_62680 [Desulfobacterales bacterium]|nr:hypothetical protein [Desulfobacterales bacterium]